MNPRLYPLSKETFDREICPLIESETKRMDGRPPKIDHYTCFCAMPKCRRCRSRGGICRRNTAPVAHNMRAFQKAERERSFMEDSLRMKAKEVGSDGHCIYGFRRQ
jgi:hypothetical protein